MRHNNEDKEIAVRIVQFLFALILTTMICFSFIGCSTLTEIPVQTIEKIVYKDSTVYIKDTIEIPIPYEKIVEVVPKDTTSQITTSLAFSEAKIEGGYLHHSLEQKGEIKTIIDTLYVTQTIEKIVEKEVPIIQEIEKPIRDNIFWISIIFNIIVILFIAFKIYLKLKA